MYKLYITILLTLTLNAGDTMKDIYDFNVATITKNEQSMAKIKLLDYWEPKVSSGTSPSFS